MKKSILAWLAVALAIAGIAGGLTLYKSRQFGLAEAASKASPEPVEAVATVTARKGEVFATTRAIGTVVAIRQLDVRNELAGTISEMGFTSGRIVEAGQLLVQLDVRQEKAALAAAEADVNLAKQTLERRESLKASAAFSAQEVDKARAEFVSATARASNLAVVIDKKRIVAPFRAHIGITNLQANTYLESGTLIARLQSVDDDAFVDFALPQDDGDAIRPGMSVTLTGAAIAGKEAAAEIVAEDNSIDSANRTMKFRALAKGLGTVLRPGTFVDVVAVTSKPRETVLVPLTSVRRSSGGQHVFVIVDEGGKRRARQRPVQTGAAQGDDIAIEKGLVAGELIAAAGSFKLRDGLLLAAEPPNTSGAASN